MLETQKPPDLAEIAKTEVYIGSLNLSPYVFDLLFSRVGGTWLLVLGEDFPNPYHEPLRVLCEQPLSYPVYFGVKHFSEDTQGIGWFYHFFRSQFPARKLRSRYMLPEFGYYGSYYFLEGAFLYGRARITRIPF